MKKGNNAGADMKKGLAISAHTGEVLSKEQKAFNRLIKKIETLRTDLLETAKELDALLQYHQKHIYPVEMQIQQHKKDVLKLLFGFYTDKALLSRTQRTSILKLMKGLLQAVLESADTRPDDELQTIYEAVEGISFDMAESIDFESMKEDMAEALRRRNIHADLGDLHKDMDPEDIARKIHEVNELLRREREKKPEQKAAKKQSKKQVERIEKERLMEEARSKNISSIYKQLVKILHPDLEQDESQKPIKEELMKQLSIAYKNNDLHGLLRLELEWINRSAEQSQKLADDKLEIYNAVLKEQVLELEMELSMLFRHPRYIPLAQFGGLFRRAGKADLIRAQKEMSTIMATLITTASRLRGRDAMTEIKDLVKMQKENEKFDPDNLF